MKGIVAPGDIPGGNPAPACPGSATLCLRSGLVGERVRDCTDHYATAAATAAAAVAAATTAAATSTAAAATAATTATRRAILGLVDAEASAVDLDAVHGLNRGLLGIKTEMIPDTYHHYTTNNGCIGAMNHLGKDQYVGGQ